MKNLIDRKVKVNFTVLLSVVTCIFTFNACLEESPIPTTNYSVSNSESVIDVDGNMYNTVTIGTQVWMTENLRTTKYRNGSSLTNITQVSQWGALTTGAYCSFSNSTTTQMYGRFYNWYAVNDSRNIAPAGWHVPTYNEWLTLWYYLGGDSLVGGQLKETGTSHWYYPNSGATNGWGFNALPAGFIKEDGNFYGFGYYTLWWTVTENASNSLNAECQEIDYNHPGLYDNNLPKNWGLSIRCVRDIAAYAPSNTNNSRSYVAHCRSISNDKEKKTISGVP